MYRQDIALKFMKYSQAKIQSSWRDARRKKHLQGPEKAKVAAPSSFEQLMLQNTWGHLKSVAGQYMAITLPQRPDGEMQFVTQSFAQALYGDEARRADHIVEDISEELALPEDAVAPPLCFKVLSTSIGKMKTMATFFPEVGPKLEEGCMAITLHQAALVNDDHLSVDIQPRMYGDGNMNVMVCTDFVPGCSLQGLTANARGWIQTSDASSQAVYTIPIADVPRSELDGAIAKLVDAYPHDADDTKGTVEGDPKQEPWRSLLELGFVVAKGQRGSASSASASATNRFRLTPQGLRNIRTTCVYTKSRGVFDVRAELPLPQLTPFEMTLKLHAGGWEWRLFPKAVKDRLSLHHDTSLASGCYYTLGKTLIPSYLQCLLCRGELRTKFGVQQVPHYGGKAPVKRYDALLKGQPFTVDDQPPAQRPALRNELDDDDAALAIADQNAVQALEGDVGDADETLDQALERMLEEEEKRVQESLLQPQQEGSDLPSDEDNAAPATGDESVVEAGARPEDKPDSLEPAEGSLPQASDPQGRQKLDILPWGAIDIARTTRNKKGEVSFEARCPFHRLSKKTTCKKTFSYTPDTEELVLASLRHWGNTARQFNRQVHHMDSMKSCFDVPLQSYDILLAGQILEQDKPAPGTVKTDKELDQEEAVALRARGRGRGRGAQQARGGRQRGVGRGKGGGRQPAAAPPSRTRSTSPSSSSSSSSSSS